MAEVPLGFKLVWSDYTGYVEGRTRLLKHGQKRAARPKTHSEIYPTKAAAEAARAQLEAQGDGVVASITPVTLKPSDRQQAPLLDDLPVMTKRLTP